MTGLESRCEARSQGRHAMHQPIDFYQGRWLDAPGIVAMGQVAMILPLGIETLNRMTGYPDIAIGTLVSLWYGTP